MVLTLEREPKQRRQWGRIVARAWDDDAFRQRLLAEPGAVLREEGFEVPPGIEVRVGDNDEPGDTYCLHLPPRPASDDLIDEDLGGLHNAPVARGGGLSVASAACRSSR
jgi:hypothetical protein